MKRNWLRATPGVVMILLLSLGSIAGPTGTTQNIGGTTGRIRFAPLEYFDTIEAKSELSVATTNASLVEISADHTFLTGKGFHECYITRDSGSAEGKMNQERDTTGMTTEYKGMTPGSDIATHSLLLQLANRKVIALIELADGQWLQLGTERFPAELKYTWKSGGNEKGYRGWELVLAAFESSNVLYSGVISMFP
jgi:hypothetical protein